MSESFIAFGFLTNVLLTMGVMALSDTPTFAELRTGFVSHQLLALHDAVCLHTSFNKLRNGFYEALGET